MSNRNRWVLGVGFAVFGGLGFGLYRSLLHVQESAARAS